MQLAGHLSVLAEVTVRDAQQSDHRARGSLLTYRLRDRAETNLRRVVVHVDEFDQNFAVRWHGVRSHVFSLHVDLMRAALLVIHLTGHFNPPGARVDVKQIPNARRIVTT